MSSGDMHMDACVSPPLARPLAGRAAATLPRRCLCLPRASCVHALRARCSQVAALQRDQPGAAAPWVTLGPEQSPASPPPFPPSSSYHPHPLAPVLQQGGGAVAPLCRALHEQLRRARERGPLLAAGRRAPPRRAPPGAIARELFLPHVDIRPPYASGSASPPACRAATVRPSPTARPLCSLRPPAALEDIRRYFHRDFSLLQYNSSIPWADSGIDGGIVLGDGTASLAVLGSSTSSLADADGGGLGSGSAGGGGGGQQTGAAGAAAGGGGSSTGHHAEPAAVQGFPDPREMAMKG